MANNDEPTISVTLEDYYRLLQKRLGLAHRTLVASWDDETRLAIYDGVNAIITENRFLGSVIPNFLFRDDGSVRSNQSKGNVAADALAHAIGYTDGKVKIVNVPNAGYPDKAIKCNESQKICCFEIKATSDWNDNDGNRRVLTSSPKKLLNAISEGIISDPPLHTVATVIYDEDSGLVQGVRLDFLEPTSVVNVRFEASTSHKLLNSGTHHSFLLLAAE